MIRIADSHSDYSGFHACGGYGGRLYDHGSIADMICGGLGLQVFAAYVPREYSGLGLAGKQFDFLRGIIDNSGGSITLCTNADDIKREGGLKAVLAIESGETIDCDPGAIGDFYRLGTRMMSLTWNDENGFAGGCNTKGGLKEKGVRAVQELRKFNIALDVSHLNEQSFWEASEIYGSALCASHSCVYEVKHDARNLKCDQIKHIIKEGGFIGINFYTLFLKERKASIGDILEHVEHILSLGGECCVGFGSDFFGIQYTPDGLSSPAEFQKLPEEMAKRNYTDTLISKICYSNFENYILKFLLSKSR